MSTPFAAPSPEDAVFRARPRQKRSKARVQKILDTAAALIVRHGRVNVTALMVAEAAGLPVSSIYQYFANMDAVAAALVERAIANVDAVTLAVAGTFAPSGDPMQIVSAMIDAALARYEAEPGAITLILELSHTQAYQETAARSDARIAADLAEILCAALPAVAPAAIFAYTSVAKVTAGALQLMVWRTPEGPQREAVIREWKLTAGARLAALFAEAAQSSDDRSDARAEAS
jgi:AcrR family transcriptional regulator